MKDIQEGRTNGAILKKFYWRRTLRIFPIYYIACIILLLLNYQDSSKFSGTTFLIQPLLRHSWLKYIGRISYGVYLYHIFVSTGLQDTVNEYLLSIDYSLLPALRYNLYIITAPLYAGITILLAAISYRIIELPFLKLKTKFK